MSSILKLAGALALALLAAGPAAAQEVVTGAVKVVDADIVMVDKQRVILWGVDAPERTQKCKVGSLEWACYEAARRGLGEIIASGEASCTLIDEKPDQFNRRHGVCISAGKDVGGELVRLGYARAYVEQVPDYLPQEEEAKGAKAGIFQDGADVMDPWVWRKRDPRNYR
jgi:endonuclease YncB( thermonuclease family)